MSIFKEMHPKWQFDSWREYYELKRMLSEAIERGHVEIIPAIKGRQIPRDVTWYREKETGVIYSLGIPDPPARGRWMPVDIEDFVPKGPAQ